jgi:UDP-2,3-diacylglucosamine pyrophosphatase LpxH
VRLGFTADLHYGISRWVDRRALSFIEKQIAPAGLDLLVVAGDVAEMEGLRGRHLGHWHRQILARLREAAKCRVAFCAGNHDLWCDDAETDSWAIYREVLAGVGHATGTTYLDAENLLLDELAIVGCYGHYDFSLRTPDLVIAGRTVEEEHYRSKIPPGHVAPVWMDAQKIRWRFDDAAAAEAVCAATRSRLEAALKQRRKIVFVSHGVPRAEANGHAASEDPLSLFLNAFSGTLRAEQLIRLATAQGATVLSVSGHTHRAVDRLTIEGVDYLNVGGTYGEARLVTMDL